MIKLVQRENMKVPLANYHLNNLTNRSLRGLTIDDISSLLQENTSFEIRKWKDNESTPEQKTRNRQQPLCQTFKKPSTPGQSSTSLLSPKVFRNQTSNLSPVLQSPLTLCLSDAPPNQKPYTQSLLQCSPQSMLQMKSIQLYNLSYSQPSTPCYSSLPIRSLETPASLRKLNGFSGCNYNVPLTPIINDAVRVLQQFGNPCRNSNDPNAVDILQIIDDDTKPVEYVEKQLHRFSDIVVDDSNVADFLLDICEDYNSPIPSGFFYSKSPLNRCQKVSEPDQNPVPKRKCKRAKPVCFDESILYRQEKKAKDRENKRKRKEQFSSESFGFRKSERNSNKRIKYTE